MCRKAIMHDVNFKQSRLVLKTNNLTSKQRTKQTKKLEDVIRERVANLIDKMSGEIEQMRHSNYYVLIKTTSHNRNLLAEKFLHSLCFPHMAPSFLHSFSFLVHARSSFLQFNLCAFKGLWRKQKRLSKIKRHLITPNKLTWILWINIYFLMHLH